MNTKIEVIKGKIQELKCILDCYKKELPNILKMALNLRIKYLETELKDLDKYWRNDENK